MEATKAHMTVANSYENKQIDEDGCCARGSSRAEPRWRLAGSGESYADSKLVSSVGGFFCAESGIGEGPGE
jgi:hypothetical protein